MKVSQSQFYVVVYFEVSIDDICSGCLQNLSDRLLKMMPIMARLDSDKYRYAQTNKVFIQAQ